MRTGNNDQWTDNAQRGFTLIELVVALAIVGILAAFAYPTYQEYVRQSRRADMVQTLMQAQHYLQRYYSARDSYKDAELPSSMTQSPATGTPHYIIEIIESGTAVPKATKASGYDLRARRTGFMRQDRCGDLSVDQNATYTMSNHEEGLTMDLCFKGL